MSAPVCERWEQLVAFSGLEICKVLNNNVALCVGGQ